MTKLAELVLISGGLRVGIRELHEFGLKGVVVQEMIWVVGISSCILLILGEDSGNSVVITCHFIIFVLELMAELTWWSVGVICSLEQKGLQADLARCCGDLFTVFRHGVLCLWEHSIGNQQLL